MTTIEPKFGEVWQVGPHLLACGDLERGHADHLVKIAVGFGMQTPSVFYCDPPWNVGIAKAFRRGSGQGDPTAVGFESLIHRVLAAAADVPGDVYVEMGKQHIADLRGWLVDVGLNLVGEWEVTYYRTKPCFLLQATHVSRQPLAIGGDGSEATGMDDDATPAWAIQRSSQPGATVFDPCLGLGATSRAAHKTGRSCLGMELDPARMARSLDWLAHRTKATPRKLGELPAGGL